MSKWNTGELRKCEQCGAEIYLQTWQIKKGLGKLCSAKCRIEASKKVRRPIGRRYKTPQGYIAVYMPDHPDTTKNGIMMEHRVIAAEMLGRRLLRSEDVHHINGVRDDNRPENLQVLKSGEHARITGEIAVMKRQTIREQFNALKIEVNRYRELYGPIVD